MNLPLEKQVCSLELAKKLKELGVRQESLYYWQQIGTRKASLVQTRNTGDWNVNEDTEWYPAFTVAELGDMLPKGERFEIENDRYAPWLFRWMEIDQVREEFQGDTEADARAAMLIYLIENGLLDVTSIEKV